MQLCDEAVVNLFWSRVQSGQSVLLADELATVQLSDPAFVAFFKVDVSSSPEIQSNTKSERQNSNTFLARVTLSNQGYILSSMIHNGNTIRQKHIDTF